MKATMFEELCKSSTLLVAWKMVKAKGSAGGIDGISIAEMDKDIGTHIQTLQEELFFGTWKPQPYLRIQIPKKNSEYRKLGLLTIKDKIVQQALKNLIEQRFENIFLPNSYAYRPEKGHTKAVKFTRSIFQNKKYPYALRLDIDNYFNNINHQILFERVKHIIPDNEVLRLIELSIKMGVVSKKLKWEEDGKGVPQGAVLSPILANFYLHPFDQFVLSKDVKYVRYADDFIITCKTKEDAEHMLVQTTSFLETRLKLQLNVPSITSVSDGVDFLGLMIDNKGISVSPQKMKDLQDRISLIEWQDNDFNPQALEKIEGIHRYYVPLLAEDILGELDEFLISRIEQTIRLNFESIAGKSILQKSLEQIKFYSQANVLQAKQKRMELLNLYSELKKQKKALENESKNKLVIRRRKLEYRQKEVEATELVINNQGVFIGVSNKGITLKSYGKQQPVPPMANLKHITVLSTGVSISSNAIAYCMKNRIPIDYFNPTGQHLGTVLSQGLISTSLWSTQTALTVKKRSELAAKIIYGKLKNQLNLIKYYHKYHKHSSGNLVEVYDNVQQGLENLITQIKGYSSRSLEYKSEIMGMEASGAVLYWSYIKELLSDDDIGFLHRERRGATDLFNCMLNYGYALLYARVWQSLLYRKLNPADSVLHEQNNGKPTFVYDVIELFRCQAVDRVVISLVQKGEQLQMKKGLLTDETKKLLVQNIIERLNKYEKYRGEDIKFLEIINRQTKDIASYIAEDSSFKPYIAKW